MSLKNVLNELGDAIREKTGLTAPMTLEEMAEQVRNLYGFRVTGYASTEAMEADAPEENTIGVITETEITGWLISGEMDEEMAEGAVWIRAGSGDVRFTALSPNGIRICPDLCRQMAEGTAELRDAYIYQTGVWVPFAEAWDGYYFNAGDQYEDITGGWGAWLTSGTCTISGVLTVRASAAGNLAVLGTNKAVDLTGISTIYYTSKENTNAYPGYMRICSEKDYTTSVKTETIASATTGSVDVSNLTGAHYICLYANGGGNGAGYASVSKIWTE